MALSNIGREPQREITESAVGIVVTLLVLPVYVGACYYVNTRWLGSTSKVDVIMGTLTLSLFSWLIPIIFLFATHWVGEVVCGWMRAIGFDPRPERRY